MHRFAQDDIRKKLCMNNSFGAKDVLKVGNHSFEIFRLDKIAKALGVELSRLPVSIRILLENLLRNEDNLTVKKADIEALARWDSKAPSDKEIAFMPARVLLQDFTGVPAVVDLAAMREAIQKLGGDVKKINPLQSADLVIDHSVQVDYFGAPDAFAKNAGIEFERNRERYLFLKWGQKAFQNFSVVPPETGIVHQVNLEYLAKVVFTQKINGVMQAYPDTLVGTDSHTTMINGLGVVGWGVGGIEAEAVMLGQPISMLIPQVVGFKLAGTLREGVTATDAVLTVTQILRKKGVVGKFVEFYGAGLSNLSLADRATIANMSPEYGATIGLFPVDSQTLDYLKLTGRPKELGDLVEAYYKEQGLFRTDQTPDPVYSDVITLDLSTVEPSLAGPKRPQDRVPLARVKENFQQALTEMVATKKLAAAPVDNHWTSEGGSVDLGDRGQGTGDRKEAISNQVRDGAVVIAAITSCTNTSNPAVMLAAGLLAKKALEKGLKVKPWVKTSLAPGSKVVIEYLKASGLLQALEAQKFHLVGYGCTTCIGNSGPLPEPVAQAIKEKDLYVAAVLSGNRNFEGRIHPQVRANYLASPPLVVAYALAGTMEIDLTKDPLGSDSSGKPVYLRDIWPTNKEITEVMRNINAEMFQKQYANVFKGDDQWNSLKISAEDYYRWEEKSTYIRRPPYFDGMVQQPAPLKDISNARVLAVLGDSITTDHISPAGSIAKDSPAGKYLIEHGIEPKDFNSYGARRGNHEVMIRGTFANIRLKNLLAPGTEGGWTRHLPDGEKMAIYDASVKYQKEKTLLIIIAGKEYGSGSSRDWAAKGPVLLGVKAVIAESFERIHRSNLIGMGVLPLQFLPNENREALKLTGEEIYSIEGIADGLTAGKKLTVRVHSQAGDKSFQTLCRIDTPRELDYYRHGGILQYVLRELLK